jgi:hypothetical protein
MATQNYEVTVNPNAITLDLTTQNNILTVETVDYVLSLSRTGGQGAQGYSAYEIAVQNGYTGTAQEFSDELASIAEKSALAVASAAAAATSATSASNSATASATSASNSSISAGAASASANAAAQSAVTAAAQANASSQSATNSAASALQSSNYADDSENSAIDSQLSAADAAASEDAAASSEANALLYRNEAQASASSALASSNNADSQALAASLSAASAATSATNADNSEDNAAASATSALNSATSANTSANQAAISATTATTQATSATNSATAAAASQADALVSKNSASASASTATTKASEASNSAATAATKATEASASAAQAVLSATSASTSASTATLKAAEAAQSAADAAAAQAAAEASLASFRSTYLGELNADPTLDGNGDPVMIGAEYFNSVANKLKVYTSTGWQFYDATAQTASQNAALSASQAASSAATSQSYATTAINKAAEAASSADAADASADAALASENAAESSEINASASENYALNYKNAAATSADLASSYASASGVSATNAATSATTATTQATNSANSATASATSATNSANSALASANSATNAANSAASAATSAANAGVSEANADTSEANALASANTATTKAAEASTSASDAAVSATNSAASATSSALSEGLATTAAATATTKASEASVSATSASGSAATATTKAAEATSAASSATTSAANAATSATNAANSASSANTSSASASTSATLAGNSANAAALSETNAATSASAASIYAANAATSATSADTSESNAEIYADDALASSIAAANTVTTVTGYANTASIKADEASASATSAANSATSATASANTATTQATNASNSATAASTSATNASASATTASTQASNAAASASSASTSASAANISAINADTSATNAASSANTANVAKAAAEAARDQALAAFDNFDDKYLGEKASNPTLDNDGNPLVVGALYFNTALQGMRVYTGTAWVAAYMSGDGYLLASNNLSELTNVVTARANLGLGTSALANGYNLDGLTDVTITSATNGQVLEYESATSLWKNKTINALPSQETHNGQFLTTDGTNASWATVDALPPQATHADKFLRTDGTAAYWATVNLPTSAYSRTSFTATAGQTTFNVTYPLGSIQVYVNGVLLRTSDYTATNETSFTLNVPASAGAAVDAFVYNVYGIGQVLAENIIGTVAIGSGGTGATTASGARTNLGLGTAATTDSTAYATAAQGIKADNAVSEITSIDGSVTITATGTSRDLSGVSALNLISQVRNETGATLTKGTVVYVSGAASNKALVSKAVATGDSTSAQTFGMVREDIPHNQNGFVTLVGAVRGIDTSMYLNGTQLYLSGTTAGLYTSTKPYAPIHLVYVGVVTYSHANQGTIEVKIQNGYEMDEIHDVSAQSPTNGDTLVYVSSTGLWTKTPQSSLSVASAAAVPFSGVTGKPTTLSGYGITDAYSSSNPSNYISGITSGDVTGALGYTPYNSTNPNGYISGITSSNVTTALGYTPENAANKGNANGYASLDGSGLVPASQLPSYVDDVLEYANLASFPGTGTTGKIYVALDTNKTYRWSGSAYIYITSGAVDSVAGKTGVVTLNNSDVGLGSVENKSSATIRSEITSSNVTTALGFTPYNATNPSGYITSSALSPYLLLSGGTMSGDLTATRIRGVNNLVLNTYTTVNPSSNVYLYSPLGDRDAWIYLDSADTGSNWGIYHRQIDSAVSGLPANSLGFIGGGTSALQAWISLANGSANFAGALTQAGNQVLHAGNYNSYSPTLTGGNASGTWGINVTGNANSASTLNSGAVINGTAYFRKNQTSGDYTTAALWTESYGNTTTGIAFHISGVAGRFLEMRNNSSELFWQSAAILNSGNYSSYALPLSGGTISGQTYISTSGYPLQLISTQRYGLQVRNTNNSVNSGYGWWLAHDANSNFALHADGIGDILTVGRNGSFTVNGNTVLNAGNYNSYSPTLTGGNASGTWGINITGNAGGSSTSVSTSSSTGIQSSHVAGINTTTPGLATYGIAFSGSSSTDNAQGITWGWSGTNAQAGIYVQSSGSYGTKMYFGTTDSFATGSKTSMSIDHVGNVNLPRGTFSNGSVWINNGTNSGNYNENIRLFNAPNGASVIAFSASGTSGTPTTSLLGYSDRFEIRYADAWQQRTYNGYVEALGSFRAPIFYDSNDTGYYTDPRSTSNLFDLTITGSSHKYLFINPGNGYEAMVRYNGGSGNSWYVGKRTANVIVGSADFHFYSEAVSASVCGIDTSGNVFASGSSRAPIFYDSNNTGYYLDPSSTGTSMNAAGNVTIGNSGANTGLFINYGGGVGDYAVVGRCYQAGTNNQTIHVFSTAWQGGTLQSTSAGSINLDGANGTTIGAWNNNDMWIDKSGNSQSRTSSRAPIFYDSNNTAYYCDPNSVSRLDVVRSNVLQFIGSDQFAFGSYWAGGAGYPGYQYIGGNNRFGFSGTSGYIDVYTDGNYYGGIDLYGANRLVPLFDANQGGGALYSSIIYDSNSTGFYLDPSSAGKSMIVNGNIELTARSESWGEGIRINVPTAGTWGGIRWNRSGASGPGNWALGYTGVNSTDDLTFWSGTTNTIQLNLDHSGNLIARGNITAYGSPSDRKLKENIQPLTGALNKVLQLQGCTFTWKKDSREHEYVGLSEDIGFIADEVQEILPAMVRKGDDGYLSLRDRGFSALLVEALKEQNQEVVDLKSKLNQQQSELDELKSLVKSLLANR